MKETQYLPPGQQLYLSSVPFGSAISNEPGHFSVIHIHCYLVNYIHIFINPKATTDSSDLPEPIATSL